MRDWKPEHRAGERHGSPRLNTSLAYVVPRANIWGTWDLRDCGRQQPAYKLRRVFQPKDAAADILAAIVESSDDAIIAKDLEGTVLAWNRGAERMYGYTAAEMAGRPVSTIIPVEHPDELKEILARIGRGEHVEPYETVRMTKDGRRLDVWLAISPIRNAQGTVVGASAIARD